VFEIRTAHLGVQVTGVTVWVTLNGRCNKMPPSAVTGTTLASLIRRDSQNASSLHSLASLSRDSGEGGLNQAVTQNQFLWQTDGLGITSRCCASANDKPRNKQFQCTSNKYTVLTIPLQGSRGVSVEALHYKPEGRGFDSL
jgi:hypothetical protein